MVKYIDAICILLIVITPFDQIHNTAVGHSTCRDILDVIFLAVVVHITGFSGIVGCTSTYTSFSGIVSQHGGTSTCTGFSDIVGGTSTCTGFSGIVGGTST